MSTHTTIPALVDEGLDKPRPDDLVCSTKRNGQWHDTTIDEFKTRVNEFSRGLYSLGIRKGDKVSLHSESSTEWVIIDQAVLRLGAVLVPIYTSQSQKDIKHIVGNAGVRLYIVSTQELFDNLPSDIMDGGSILHVVSIRGDFGDLTYDQVLEKGRSSQDYEASELKGSDLCTILYTSGTTGVPKGVMITHGNVVFNINAVRKRLPFGSPSRVISYLPLAHSFERAVSILYLHIGCPIFFCEDPTELKEDLPVVRPTHMTTVPRVLEKIHAGLHAVGNSTSGIPGMLLRRALKIAEGYDLTNKKKALGSTMADLLVFRKIRKKFGDIKFLTSGGAALSPELQSFFNGLGIVCGQGYGLTETAPVVSIYDFPDILPGSCGTCIPGVEARIGENDELLVRGPNVMKGYYKMPEATAEAIDSDGWFHTGDTARIDDADHIYITGRIKQLFKLSTGKYIAPTPIETKLCNDALIENAVIVGPGLKFCSALIAVDPVVVTQTMKGIDDITSSPELIAKIQKTVDAVNEQLSHWEQVKQFRITDKPFTIETGELTPTLKVKQHFVMEKYKALIDSMYS